MLHDVLAENQVATRHGAGDVVLGPADGAGNHVAHAGRGRDRRLERAQVHADVNDALVHVRPFPWEVNGGRPRPAQATAGAAPASRRHARGSPQIPAARPPPRRGTRFRLRLLFFPKVRFGGIRLLESEKWHWPRRFVGCLGRRRFVGGHRRRRRRDGGRKRRSGGGSRRWAMRSRPFCRLTSSTRAFGGRRGSRRRRTRKMPAAAATASASPQRDLGRRRADRQAARRLLAVGRFLMDDDVLCRRGRRRGHRRRHRRFMDLARRRRRGTARQRRNGDRQRRRRLERTPASAYGARRQPTKRPGAAGQDRRRRVSRL